MLTISTITKPGWRNNLPVLVFEWKEFFDDFGEIGGAKPKTSVSSKYMWKRFLKIQPLNCLIFSDLKL